MGRGEGGGILTRDYDIRVQEEEQEARVCERERGRPPQTKEPRDTEQGGGEEKGIGRPAETEKDRTKSKNSTTNS